MKLWARRAGRALAFFIVVYLLWLGAHSVFGAAKPKPLWTKADLPPAPAAAENGWDEAHEIRVKSSDAVERDVLQRPAAEQANAAVENAHALDELLAPAKARHDIEALERAIAKPRFADDCPLDLDVQCKTVPWMDSHRLLLLEAHRLFRVEGIPPCAALLTNIVRADVDAATSSRTAVSHMIALATLREALTTTLSLMRAKPDIKSTLEGLDLKKLDARRMVIAEYIMLGRPDIQLASVRTEDGDTARPSLRERLLPYDEGRTDIEIDRRAQLYYDAAARGSAEGLPEPKPLQGEGLWWVWNPKGKMMLDVMLLDWRSLIKRITDLGAEIATLRQEILAEL